MLGSTSGKTAAERESRKVNVHVSGRKYAKRILR